MKVTRCVSALLFFVAAGCNQQSASQAATNETATKIVPYVGTSGEVVSAATATNAPASSTPVPSSSEHTLEKPWENDPIVASSTPVPSSIEQARAKAEKGDAVSQYLLGMAYRLGSDVAADNREAAKWFQKAVDQGSTNALLPLAEILGEAESPLYNPEKSFELARRAAELGDASAQVSLGFKYVEGQGVIANSAEGLRSLRQGISALQPETAKALSNTNTALLAKGLKMLIADNASRLGTYYFEGRFLPKDVTNGVYWYEKAAEQGNEPYFQAFQAYLGFIHATETRNYAEAVKGFLKAAEGGNAIAQYDLGLQYANGQGVPRDDAEAAKWFRKAAEQGSADAQGSLGECYYDGRGVTKDTGEAVKWYLKAAEQGVAGAQNNLAVCYAKGDGVAKDKTEAVRWYRKAANQGLAPAQYSLGACYGNGVGVPKDYIEAYKWMNLALAQDDENAKTYLPFVEMRMTAEQIAEAQRLARGFRPSKTPHVTGVLTGEQIADSRPSSSGTGFFISADGFLVTNEHVVRDATQIRLVTSAGFISGNVAKVDAANDLALLKAEGRFVPLPIVASRTVRLGGTVATVGFPDIGLQGFAPKFARGEVASLSGAGDDPRYFQISVPVQPGNSGGALVDERGNVVGVVSAKLNASAALAATGALPENVNYAVKSSLLLSFLESVPQASDRLKQPNTGERKLDDVVKEAQQAAVLVLVY